MNTERKEDRYDHSDHSTQHREKDDLGVPGQSHAGDEGPPRNDKSREAPKRPKS